jgi:DNA-binding winged helix-turn-helix (wHTH) protein/tetratricopeptide (TPR) repeat protein
MSIQRFGPFEADLSSGELRKHGLRIRLHDQPFTILSMLLEKPGEVVSREEIVQRLWGEDRTFVDFDQSLGAAVSKLRRALGDSASSPRYIETVRQRGFRMMMPVAIAPPDRPAQSRVWAALVALALLGTAAAYYWMRKPAGQETSNQAAYAAYQKGRYLWQQRTPAALERSAMFFQEAIDQDPKYARAYVGLADSYALRNLYGAAQRREHFERARRAVHEALRLDPGLAEAHTTAAFISFYYDWNWKVAEAGYRRAIEIDPNYATAYQWYAELLYYQGRSAEATRQIRRAHELNPQSVVIGVQLASPDLTARKYEPAIARLRESMKLDPDFVLGRYMLGTALTELGRFEEALAEYHKIETHNFGLTGLGYTYARAGDVASARKFLAKLIERAGRNEASPYNVAHVYAGLGDKAEALAWLGKAFDQRDERMVMLRQDCKFDGLRSDPRFGQLLRAIGFS